MRDPETEKLLADVKAAAVAARAAGCSTEAIVFEATAGAFAKPDEGSWPSAEARHMAELACGAVK